MSKEGNKEDMEALKKELDEVKKHLATVIAKEKSAMEPKVVFTPRERKLTKFSGQKDGEQTVEEFIDEVELLLRTRPTSSEEKVDFILSHLEGPAREELRYRSASEKKTPATVLGILREVFGERSTISELLSDFYQCRQKEGQSLQEYSHDLMNKLSKVCKRDPKAVQDRDKAIRSQFAENVREPWLKRDLKKRLRDHPDLAFNDIREEATLLVQDADASFTVKPKNIKVERDILDISIFAEQATSNTLELTKAVADLTQEVSNLKVEINNLKSSGDTRQGTKPPPRCYNCNKIGHIKRNCRSERRTENGLNKNSLLPGARE
ncbi:unnamed protein product [Mytilus coruscus]|uniref:CCHC-type domain-containing protein n=1 Tax=Mytilus coruscus TaxID=42192 RepID=A0A6J8AM22_MYTCO|nr:unnamed protein product [Mytilus coruscus]